MISRITPLLMVVFCFKLPLKKMSVCAIITSDKSIIRRKVIVFEKDGRVHLFDIDICGVGKAVYSLEICA